MTIAGFTDLPGYGFAKVSKDVKEKWQSTLSKLLTRTDVLKGISGFYGYSPSTKRNRQANYYLGGFSRYSEIHVVLNKADKLKSGARKTALLAASIQAFRSNFRRIFPAKYFQPPIKLAWKK